MILAVLLSVALVAFGAWYFRYTYIKTRNERVAWLKRDRQIRRDRGEDV